MKHQHHHLKPGDPRDSRIRQNESKREAILTALLEAQKGGGSYNRLHGQIVKARQAGVSSIEIDKALFILKTEFTPDTLSKRDLERDMNWLHITTTTTQTGRRAEPGREPRQTCRGGEQLGEGEECGCNQSGSIPGAELEFLPSALEEACGGEEERKRILRKQPAGGGAVSPGLSPRSPRSKRKTKTKTKNQGVPEEDESGACGGEEGCGSSLLRDSLGRRLFESLVSAALALPEACVWRAGGKFILSNADRNQAPAALLMLLVNHGHRDAAEQVARLIQWTETCKDCVVTACQINLHANQESFHAQHRDIFSVAQKAKAGRDCTCSFTTCIGTMCFSLGSSRLVQLSTCTDNMSPLNPCGGSCTGCHERRYLQNGEAMWFNDVWNTAHTHGVPKIEAGEGGCGPRISIAMLCAPKAPPQMACRIDEVKAAEIKVVTGTKQLRDTIKVQDAAPRDTAPAALF